MKTVTVRLPETIADDLEAESRARMVSVSDVIRERLQQAARPRRNALDGIVDLIGSLDGLPEDFSARKKHYLRATGYGRKRHR
ncbi:MAG TPA: CopG family transcriptional regulator [Rhizomicrobium sp.]|jgi:Arc/MetJ-type ribon-helix-helix transcriptional regulator|nr:CopG family transcriptional regulator [Rhizomicrobium sp.]